MLCTTFRSLFIKSVWQYVYMTLGLCCIRSIYYMAFGLNGIRFYIHLIQMQSFFSGYFFKWWQEGIGENIFLICKWPLNLITDQSNSTTGERISGRSKFLTSSQTLKSSSMTSQIRISLFTVRSSRFQTFLFGVVKIPFYKEFVLLLKFETKTAHTTPF